MSAGQPLDCQFEEKPLQISIQTFVEYQFGQMPTNIKRGGSELVKLTI